jgi:hypothetical protein
MAEPCPLLSSRKLILKLEVAVVVNNRGGDGRDIMTPDTIPKKRPTLLVSSVKSVRVQQHR